MFQNTIQLTNFFLSPSSDEIAQNVLGSQAGETLLHELKPKHWFAAHLHCRFAATIQHNEKQSTQFLALDKCLPRRQYLEVRFNSEYSQKIKQFNCWAYLKVGGNST